MEQPYLYIFSMLHGDIKSLADAPENFDESKSIIENGIGLKCLRSVAK